MVIYIVENLSLITFLDISQIWYFWWMIKVSQKILNLSVNTCAYLGGFTFFCFHHYLGKISWPIFFQWVETTNNIHIYIYNIYKDIDIHIYIYLYFYITFVCFFWIFFLFFWLSVWKGFSKSILAKRSQKTHGSLGTRRLLQYECSWAFKTLLLECLRIFFRPKNLGDFSMANSGRCWFVLIGMGCLKYSISFLIGLVWCVYVWIQVVFLCTLR